VTPDRSARAPVTTADAGGAGGGPRLLVPDVLRGVALLAMLIAHAVPFLPERPAALAVVMANINDLASPLFALVMGVSAQLVLQRTVRSGIPFMLFQQIIRGMILIGLGMILSEWGTWVAIVLSYLGVLLIVGAPLLFLSSRWLAVVAVGLAVVSDPLNAWARALLSGVVGADPTGLLREVASWFVLGQAYRLTNLLPFFLLGALLLRHGFVRDRVLWLMLAIAPVAYAVRPVVESSGVLVVSGSWPDTLHDVGLVFAVYVTVVVLATVRRPAAQRAIGVAFVPLRAIGAVALSLYVLHVGLLALWQGVWPNANDYLGWLLIVPGMVLVGWLWWRFVGPGPIEWAMGWMTGRRVGRPVRAAR
jgi:uncharacterized protein